MNFDIVNELPGMIPNEAQVMACKQKLMSTVTDAAGSGIYMYIYMGGGGGTFRKFLFFNLVYITHSESRQK